MKQGFVIFNKYVYVIEYKNNIDGYKISIKC